MANPTRIPAHVLPMDQAEEIVRPYFDAFDSCFRTAWDEWKSLPEKYVSSLTPRTRAAFINDRAVYHTKRLFADHEGARLVERRGFLTVLVGDKVEIRLKKLDHNKKTRNILTRFQRLYGSQRPLFGPDDDSTRLNAGYQLDTLQTKITATFVTCQVASDLIYWLSAQEGGAQGVHRFAPSPPQMPTPKVRAKDVRKASEE